MLKQQNTNIYKWGCTSQETKGFRWISLSQGRAAGSPWVLADHMDAPGVPWNLMGLSENLRENPHIQWLICSCSQK